MSRPKAFDPDQALEQAMEVFWEKGYGATTVQDLLQRMGINRFSMYQTFGGKGDLFVAALDRYHRLTADTLLRQLEAPPGGLPAIRSHFRHLARRYAAPGGWRGCLMTNSAVELAPHNPPTRKRVERHLARLEEAFYTAAREAQKRGDLRAGASPRDVARYLVGASVSLAALARTRPGPEPLRQYAETVLSTL